MGERFHDRSMIRFGFDVVALVPVGEFGFVCGIAIDRTIRVVNSAIRIPEGVFSGRWTLSVFPSWWGIERCYLVEWVICERC